VVDHDDVGADRQGGAHLFRIAFLVGVGPQGASKRQAGCDLGQNVVPIPALGYALRHAGREGPRDEVDLGAASAQLGGQSEASREVAHPNAEAPVRSEGYPYPGI
jgi:hypothetical protein